MKNSTNQITENGTNIWCFPGTVYRGGQTQIQVSPKETFWKYAEGRGKQFSMKPIRPVMKYSITTVWQI